MAGAVLTTAIQKRAKSLALERKRKMYQARTNKNDWPETMGDVDRWLSNAGKHLANQGGLTEARMTLLDARDELGINATNINKNFIDVLVDREGFLCDECCTFSKGEAHQVVRNKGSFVTRFPGSSSILYAEDTNETLCKTCFDWIR